MPVTGAKPCATTRWRKPRQKKTDHGCSWGWRTRRVTQARAVEQARGRSIRAAAASVRRVATRGVCVCACGKELRSQRRCELSRADGLTNIDPSGPRPTSSGHVTRTPTTWSTEPAPPSDLECWDMTAAPGCPQPPTRPPTIARDMLRVGSLLLLVTLAAIACRFAGQTQSHHTCFCNLRA